MTLGQGLRPGLGRPRTPTERVTQPETPAKISAMVLEQPNDIYIPEIGVANRLETGWG